ncbi:hypothetical protein [Burkholderia anthina]|uniref:hypothetical protein n=1 Tax=Burkholderia anthina TaxID=179879 RepID=UPI00158ABAB9|nr:hypothetical protein [Burkholderia anthina]
MLTLESRRILKRLTDKVTGLSARMARARHHWSNGKAVKNPDDGMHVCAIAHRHQSRHAMKSQRPNIDSDGSNDNSHVCEQRALIDAVTLRCDVSSPHARRIRRVARRGGEQVAMLASSGYPIVRAEQYRPATNEPALGTE